MTTTNIYEPIILKKKQISQLCRDSLDLKWYPGSEEKLSDFCSFCHEAQIKWLTYNIYYLSRCNACLCPPEICSASAKSGYIAILIKKYGYKTQVKDIGLADLEQMQNLFRKYIIKDEKNGN